MQDSRALRNPFITVPSPGRFLPFPFAAARLQSQFPSEITAPDSVATNIGTLKYNHGAPGKEPRRLSRRFETLRARLPMNSQPIAGTPGFRPAANALRGKRQQ